MQRILIKKRTAVSMIFFHVATGNRIAMSRGLFLKSLFAAFSRQRRLVRAQSKVTTRGWVLGASMVWKLSQKTKIGGLNIENTHAISINRRGTRSQESHALYAPLHLSSPPSPPSSRAFSPFRSRNSDVPMKVFSRNKPVSPKLQ